MAYVKQVNGRVNRVKNLGWVLRNWANIESLEWQTTAPNLQWDGIFRAYMRDGRTFATTYASFEVWKGFIDRPVLRGLRVVVNGIQGTV